MDHKKNVFLNYQQRNFSVCLKLIDAAPESARSSSHYKVLKAACLVNLDINFDEAHHILDEVLSNEVNNAFAHYGKGLAFFHQLEMTKSIPYFAKAIECDKNGSMGMAKTLKEKAEKLLQEENLKTDRRSGIAKNKMKPVINTVKKMPTSVPENAAYSPIILADVIKSKKEKPAENMKKRHSPDESTKKTNHKVSACDICFKTFFKPSSLTRHMQIHTDDRPYKCSQCNYAFIQKSDLSRHSTTHDETFPFDCKVCKKQFKTKKNLQCHQRIHIQERPFQCSLCPKSFKLAKLLKFHENLHNASNPIGCDICGKTFPAKGYIIPHMKTHTNFKPFGCNLCRRYYSTLAFLGMHFREIHGVGKAKV